MKTKDLFAITISAIVSAIFSFIICNQFIVPPTDRQEKVEVVTPISADFKEPDTTIFNDTALNPTKLIEIGPNTNDKPFVSE